MQILDEPISTWISIAAFLISFSTLLLALRRQRHDERVMLAAKEAEIKMIFGEKIRIIDELLIKYQEIENLIQRAFPESKISEASRLLEKLSNNRLNLERFKSRIETMYNNLGFEALKTTDPVVLSAIAVESAELRRDFEDEKLLLDSMMLHAEELLQENSKSSGNRRVQRKQTVRKQAVKAKKP